MQRKANCFGLSETEGTPSHSRLSEESMSVTPKGRTG